MTSLLLRWNMYNTSHRIYTWFCCALLCYGYIISLLFISLFYYIYYGCFTSSGAITWLPQCQWSNPVQSYDCPSAREAHQFRKLWGNSTCTNLCQNTTKFYIILGRYCNIMIGHFKSTQGGCQLPWLLAEIDVWFVVIEYWTVFR